MITDPRDIPGLVLWLSAEAVTGVADGGALASWPDLSPAANDTTGVNGTPTWHAAAGGGGGPAVKFDPGAYLTLPAVLNGAVAGEIMATVKATNAAAQQNGWKWGTATGDPTNHYPFSNGTVYEDFGRTVRTSFSPAGVDLTTWHRYNVWSASGDWSARLNETVKAADANTGVGFAAAPKLGNAGSFATQPLHYGTVVVYSRKLTTVERADLAAWMTANPSGGTLPPPPPPPEPVPEGWTLDESRTAGLISWSITQGRTDANSKPEPVQATIALAQELAGSCPASESRVRLAVTDDAAEWPRFTGEVTDSVIDPVRKVYTLTAAGRLGRARRAVVDGRGWPAELDGARVSHILRAAAPGIDKVIDPGTAEIIRITEPRSSAGALLDLVADSTLGNLVEQPDGTVEWHDDDHRRGSTPVLTLDDSEILNNLVWAQHVGDVVNDVQVAYGSAGGSIRAYDPASIEARESFPASVSTALKDKSDAHSLGSLIVGRRSEPVWQLPQLVVDLTRTDDAGNGVDAVKRAQLLDLRFGDRITVTGIPAGSPFTATVDLFVEGITETAYRQNGGLVWQLALSVSEPRLSGVSVRWKDVPAGFTWADVTAGLRWLDVAQIEDPTELGA